MQKDDWRRREGENGEEVDRLDCCLAGSLGAWLASGQLAGLAATGNEIKEVD